MKVKDLVQIEEIEEVVQITHHDPERIVETFVADERLENQICFLLERLLNRREKNSFFIIGGYGSGKSHLLSFLGDLFARPSLWEKVRSEKIRSFASQFRGKEFIPIWIHLPSTKADLQDLIWWELERQLRDILGEDLLLAPQVYLRTAEEDPRFEEFLKENWEREADRDAWEYLKKNRPQDALELARGFFQKIGTRPQIEEEAGEVMERVLGELTERFGDETYLVLIIDELYDFLRGKEDYQFARDIAFLRDLGEASRNYKFFVLASLQEDILDPERAGRERDNLNRIRQRYENFQIPFVNLQKVARERVLKKDEEQVEELRKLYSFLRRKYFPSLGFDERSFVDLYPIHPAILYFYERVVREVGPRSILSFLSQSALEIQEKPSDTLVTIAELYDHLRGELASHTEYGVLVRDIFPYFEANIPHWVEEEEREWALKAIKALCILNVAGKERRNCRELAELILYRGIGEVNYQFFAQLMKRLNEKAGAYLYCVEGSGVDAVYTIQIGGPPIDLIISNEMAKIRDDDQRLWGVLLEGWKEIGAIKELEKEGWCGIEVDWRNTRRQGVARFLQEADPTIIQQAEDMLQEDEKDFVLLILRPNLPADYLSQRELRDERILVWRPSEIGKEEMDTLKRCLAINLLLGSGLEREAESRLKAQQVDALQRVGALALDIYIRKGSLSFLIPPLPTNFKEAVQESVRKLLDTIYPEHPTFRREVARRNLREVVRYLAGLTSSSPTLNDYAETLSAAGLLVKEGEGQYRVDEGMELYRVIMDELRSREWVKVEDVYERLRGKPYGLRKDVVEFLILSLVGKGIVSVKGVGGEFFRSNLSELINRDFLAEGYYLRRLEIPITPEVYEFLREVLGEVKAESLEERARLWERLQELANKFQLEKLREKLEGFHPPLDKDMLIRKWEAVRERMEELLKTIEDNPSPEEGFQRMGELLRDRYRDFIEGWRSLKSLSDIAELQEEVNREIDYLRQVPYREKEELLGKLQGKKLGKEGFLEEWLKEVNSFKEEYIEKYTALHEEYVGRRSIGWEELLGLKEKASKLREIWEIMGGVGISNPAVRIMREINELEAKRCLNLYKDSLRNSPFCPNCKFNPANPLDIKEEAKRLDEEIRREWEDAVAQLKREEEKIEEMLDYATSKAEWEIKRLLDGEMVPLSEETRELLRRALGRLKVVDIDLSQLIKDGGIYRPDDFLERIRNAIKGVERGENVRIRIRLK